MPHSRIHLTIYSPVISTKWASVLVAIACSPGSGLLRQSCLLWRLPQLLATLIGSRSMFRFTIRDVLWLMVVAALAVGWWLEHRSMREQLRWHGRQWMDHLRTEHKDDYQRFLTD